MSPQLRFAAIMFRIVAIGLTVAFVLSCLGALKGLVFVNGNAGHNVGIVFVYWLDLLPQGFCLSALWVATNVVGRLNRGEAFNAAVTKGLRGIGLNLILSALAAIVIAPCFKPFFANLGTRLTVDLSVNLDVESATIGLIGLILYLVAYQGRVMKAELESFV